MASPLAPHKKPNPYLNKHPTYQINTATIRRNYSLSTKTLSKTSSTVADALYDHLLCVSGVVKPSIPRSTIKPRILPLSSFAHTTAISAKGELDIHILAPFSK